MEPGYQRDMVRQWANSPCRDGDVGLRVPRRYQGHRARLAYLDLLMVEKRYDEAHELVQAMRAD
jgi:hypothetical protein